MDDEANSPQVSNERENIADAIAEIRLKIQEGIEQANRGETLSHEEVFGGLRVMLEKMKTNARNTS
jgi:predicted transcriptional regulator